MHYKITICIIILRSIAGGWFVNSSAIIVFWGFSIACVNGGINL
jgi:hypothetical protein